MSKATESSLSDARKRRQEKIAKMELSRNTGAKTSSSTFHKSGLKRSAYGQGTDYSQ